MAQGLSIKGGGAEAVATTAEAIAERLADYAR